MPSRRRKVDSLLMNLFDSINSEVHGCPGFVQEEATIGNHRVWHTCICFPPLLLQVGDTKDSSLTPITCIPGTDYALIPKQCHKR